MDKKGQNKNKDKIWDRTFKTILLEHPALFVALVNIVFKKNYNKNVQITNLNTETYNKDTSRIIFDTSFIIEGIQYHFECQYTNDGTMVFRMFEYDFHIALAGAKRTNNFAEFNFPNSCVFYIVPNSNIPESLDMKINFQDGFYNYKVPVIRLYDYELDDIEKNGLFLLLPYEILRHIRNVTTEKNIKSYKEEIRKVYQKILDILENAFKTDKITDSELLTLLELIKGTADYKLEKYPQIMEEVDCMLREDYEPKWKKELRREAKKLAKEEAKKLVKEKAEKLAKEKVEKATKEAAGNEAVLMLRTMKQIGIPAEDIKKVASERNIPENVVNKLLNSNETKEEVLQV